MGFEHVEPADDPGAGGDEHQREMGEQPFSRALQGAVHEGRGEDAGGLAAPTVPDHHEEKEERHPDDGAGHRKGRSPCQRLTDELSQEDQRQTDDHRATILPPRPIWPADPGDRVCNAALRHRSGLGAGAREADRRVVEPEQAPEPPDQRFLEFMNGAIGAGYGPGHR